MITQIVPSLPPATDGVGDYSCRLREHWPEPNASWSFIVRRGGVESQAALPDWSITECAGDSDRLVRILDESGSPDVVLEYAGYGYHPRGVPFWLPQGLQEWRKRGHGRRLTVMFHELYARTGPLQSAFWLRPLAKKIVAQLVQIADTAVTSCESYHAQLMREFDSDAASTHRIPIGPNILPVQVGSTDWTWPLAVGGKLRVLVFGLATTRLWALEAHAGLVRALCAADLVKSITLLGKSELGPKHARRFDALRRTIAPADLWREHYDLAMSPLSEIIKQHDLGLVSNWPGTLTKSGVFSVLAAHGILPVIAQRHEAGVNLPDAFFLNDDTPASTARCIADLKNSPVVARKRETLAGFYESALQWDRIAAQWRDLLERKANGPH